MSKTLAKTFFFFIIVLVVSCSPKPSDQTQKKITTISESNVATEKSESETATISDGVESQKQNDYSPSMIDKLEIPAGFTKRYIIQEVEDFSYGNVDRKQLRITLPVGLSKQEVELNIVHATKYYYDKNKPDGISILGYTKNDDIRYFYTVAMGEYAPNGDWGSIGNNIPINKFKLKIEFNRSYFLSQ